MKKAASMMMVLAASAAVMTQVSHAAVQYADAAIKKDLEPLSREYPVIKDMLTTLTASHVTYVIRYSEKTDREEGRLESDGVNVYISLNTTGTYSLAARFVHEATHALQYEQGKVGFMKKSGNKWEGINIDVWDEAEAFEMMLEVASGTDLHGKAADYPQTTLYSYTRKLETEGKEGAVKWLALIYSGLSTEKQNNPGADPEVVNSSWAKKRGYTLQYVPYQM